MNQLFYRPRQQGSAAADFIPLYIDGKYHLFYLHDHRCFEKYGDGIAWHKIETEDFVHFDDKGEVIPFGKEDEKDLKVFTGSAVKAGDLYHIFYTGHNDNNIARGNSCECIMHAVSHDLDHWEKLYDHTFEAPEGYDKHNFRDPFVYFDQEANLYYMLLCVRRDMKNTLRSGETLRMRSNDLIHWETDSSIYAPLSYQTHECPDLFQWGEWWYLIFSEYSDKSQTHYRMSRKPDGPWQKPVNDTFDGRAYYAAKTASDGKDRYLFGWLPTRWENKDTGFWMWGGNLVVHKLLQNQDGTLAVDLPCCINDLFTRTFVQRSSLRLFCKYMTNVENIADMTGNPCFKLSMKARPHNPGGRFGILVKREPETDNAYCFSFDLDENKIEINRFPCFPQNSIGTYMLHRPMPFTDVYDVKLIADDDVFVLYVNGQIALSMRFCELTGNTVSVFSENCDVDFENISIELLH